MNESALEGIKDNIYKVMVACSLLGYIHVLFSLLKLSIFRAVYRV